MPAKLSYKLIVMNIFQFILFLSIIIWLIIPFRQIGKKYFYYFLSFALLDPLTEFLRIAFKSSSNYFFVPITCLALISILNISIIKKYRYQIIVLFVLVCIFNFTKIMSENTFIILCIIHLLIFLKLLKVFSINFVRNKLFDIFLTILIFYEITVILKFLNLLTGFTNADIYFYITTTFEILFGLFFCIFRSDDSRLVLQLK